MGGCVSLGVGAAAGRRCCVRLFLGVHLSLGQCDVFRSVVKRE